MELKDLIGKHIFSGCELTSTNRKNFGGHFENCGVCLFTLDGITYKAVENPDDGYRSYMDELEISDVAPRYSFDGVDVICYMQENDYNDILVIRDAYNGKIILEVGTEMYDDYYPVCHFLYQPENMICNDGKGEQNG